MHHAFSGGVLPAGYIWAWARYQHPREGSFERLQVCHRVAKHALVKSVARCLGVGKPGIIFWAQRINWPQAIRRCRPVGLCDVQSERPTDTWHGNMNIYV